MDDITRQMPVSIEAEQSVLGAILIDPRNIETVTQLLTPDDFYLEEHRQIYTTMQKLFAKNQKIDPVTLINMIVEDGLYSREDGTKYVRLIADVVPSASNVADYAKIVAAKSALRRLIEACGDISDTAYSEQGAVDNVLDSAERRILEVSQKREMKNFVHIRELLKSVYKEIEDNANNPDSDKGVPTGFSGLDKVLVGLSKGDFVIIGARPGVGKTSFAMNIAANVAKASGGAVCAFSLEMTGEQLAARLLSSEARVDSYAMRKGNIDSDAWERLAHAASDLSGSDILIDDSTNITITQMKAKLRRVKNLKLVIIDYLQLMQGERHSDNRTQEVSDISRNLKIMAKELGAPVICCAQLNRSSEPGTAGAGTRGRRPLISDLRESGSIEQDADIIIFLYDEDANKPDEEKQSNGGTGIIDVIVAKNRHGETRTVKMGWVKQFTLFQTIDEGHTD